MKKITFLTTLALTFLLGSISAQAKSFTELHSECKSEGFTDSELVDLFQALIKSPNPRTHVPSMIAAIKNPYAPESSHAGERFFKALSWYNDTTKGNRDGFFNLTELDSVMDKEVNTYANHLQKNTPADARLSSWKMLQKLALLKREIINLGQGGYKYQPRAMFEIDHNNPWNSAHTINSKDDFERRVIEASYSRPVLVKFGLTYCVHCLLLENLGSIPAVDAKYGDQIDVFKLWWNPKSESYTELNNLSQEQGVKSSPYFILYKDGKKINEGYVFPDEKGEGIEDFLAPVL